MTKMIDTLIKPWERSFLVILLGLISTLLVADLGGDIKEGVASGHLVVEALAGIAAAVGLVFVLKDVFQSRRALSLALEDARHWREENRRHIEGLGLAIDEQLLRWKLSEAEKEVAWLLIKGLSLKEVSQARKTTEKTARAQAVEVYAKSGTKNRSELAAFFLEDLFEGRAV